MHNYTVCVYFPTPHAKQKFNPSSSMHLFFAEMLKYDLTITVMTEQTDQQLQLATDAVLTNKEDFKKFFKVMQDSCPTSTKLHIIIGCCLARDCTIWEIKFDTTHTMQFISWLTKEKIYVKSDSLGISKTVTVGYLAKLHPCLTNCLTLKNLLQDELNDISINPNLVVELDPLLKQCQVDAMSNGNVFIPDPPSFKDKIKPM